MNRILYENPLSAILSADIKEYSRLMTEDESYTIKTLKDYRHIISGIITQHSGRVVDASGDNLLAEFANVVNAVQCAVEIQAALKSNNADISYNKRLEFRIGINIGDIVQDGDNLYGEGVNIAARIEGLADPGSVCISRGTYDHIRFGQLAQEIIDMPPDSVIGYTFLAWYYWGLAVLGESPQESIGIITS